MARSVAWEDRVLDSTIAVGGTSINDLMPNLTEDETRGATVTRLIGTMTWWSNTIGGAYGIQVLSIGIGMVGRTAFVAGAGSLPDPAVSADQPERGWLYRARYAVAQAVQSDKSLPSRESSPSPCAKP